MKTDCDYDEALHQLKKFVLYDSDCEDWNTEYNQHSFRLIYHKHITKDIKVERCPSYEYNSPETAFIVVNGLQMYKLTYDEIRVFKAKIEKARNINKCKTILKVLAGAE